MWERPWGVVDCGSHVVLEMTPMWGRSGVSLPFCSICHCAHHLQSFAVEGCHSVFRLRRLTNFTKGS
jgi:hypothetical protein